MPKSHSWSNDVKIWGSEKNNDIVVIMQENNIESIRIRFDLRNSIDDLKNKIIKLAKKLNCNFFLPGSGKIIDPNTEELNKSILSSSTIKFINNPKEFLDNLKKNKASEIVGKDESKNSE